MNWLLALRRHTLVRYLAVGGTSFVLELSALLFMNKVLDFSLALATTIAYFIGLLLAFGLQKVVAFQDRRYHFKILTWQAFLFGLLTVWNWLFTVWFVGLFDEDHVIVSRTIAQIIFACWNYALYKKVIFKQ